MKEALKFIEQFKATPYWATMKATTEGSHWHREANVAVHTEMVIDQYLKNFAGKISDTDDKVALIALLFHDVGKPQAEQKVTKPETGEVYRKYSGHEQDSSVAFSECYVRSPELQELLNPAEARAVRWIIEHHLPYQYKDKDKRRGLAVGTSEALRHANCSYETFFNCVWSDAAGRISDDHPKKMQDVADWTAEFKNIDVTPDIPPAGETCYLLVGPSGSGKTTWRDQMEDLIGGIHHVFVTSRDDMTLEFYLQRGKGPAIATPQEVYAAAWHYANMDNPKGFDSFFQKSVRKQFERAKEWRAPVVVDVVNASKKRRAHYVNEARRAGMRVIAVEFWNTLETLLKRQGTRGDKSVPGSSVRQQLYAMNCGWIGTEVDNAYVVLGK